MTQTFCSWIHICMPMLLGTCTQLSTAALLLRASKWEPPKCPSRAEQINSDHSTRKESQPTAAVQSNVGRTPSCSVGE